MNSKMSFFTKFINATIKIYKNFKKASYKSSAKGLVHSLYSSVLS